MWGAFALHVAVSLDLCEQWTLDSLLSLSSVALHAPFAPVRGYNSQTTKKTVGPFRSGVVHRSPLHSTPLRAATLLTRHRSLRLAPFGVIPPAAAPSHVHLASPAAAAAAAAAPGCGAEEANGVRVDFLVLGLGLGLGVHCSSRLTTTTGGGSLEGVTAKGET